MTIDTTPSARLVLRRGKEKSLERFHPWIFSGAIASVSGKPQEGDLVEIFDAEGEWRGIGHYQPSSIAVRILEFSRDEWGEQWLRTRLLRAIEHRLALGMLGAAHYTALRLVHGEGDFLPGLVIDLYDAAAVVQCHSLGMWRWRHAVASLLVELLTPVLGKPLSVYDKSSGTVPWKSESGAVDEWLVGGADALVVNELGRLFRVDIPSGQKTGFFIDQRDARTSVERRAHGKKVLNVFSYTGGFSVAALRGGAKEVWSVDSSKKAIALAEENMTLNGAPEGLHRGVADDAFDVLTGLDKEFELIVLDPPAFAKHHNVLDQALRGYRTINHKAIKNIAPGGLLYTFSCSQAVSVDQFRTAVFSAAAMARRRVRVLERFAQPPDHPVSIFHPEGEYLKGLLLAVE